ncbi:hypothetical protein ADK60_24485 [Streptomyces sp. XY431]|nr:hypothetical protein ADK60_24485 [Streptomyces sp. XY431]
MFETMAEALHEPYPSPTEKKSLPVMLTCQPSGDARSERERVVTAAPAARGEATVALLRLGATESAATETLTRDFP